MGIPGQDGHHLACAQAHTDVDQPDATLTKRGLAKGQTLERTGRFETHEAAAHDPMDAGVRAGRFRDAKRPGEETQHTGDGATAETRDSKEWQGQEDDVHLGPGDESLALALTLAPASLGCLERGGGAVLLVCDPSPLLALGAMVMGSLRGLVLPWHAAVSDCGPWAHQARSGPARSPEAPGDHGVSTTGSKRIERSSARCTCQASAVGRRGMAAHETRRRDDVQSHGRQAHGRRAWPVLWRCQGAVGADTVLSAVDRLRDGVGVVSRRRAVSGRARALESVLCPL